MCLKPKRLDLHCTEAVTAPNHTNAESNHC